MPKCIEIVLRRGCSPVNLLHIFRAPFPKNTSGRPLLYLGKTDRNIMTLLHEHGRYIEKLLYTHLTNCYKIGDMISMTCYLILTSLAPNCKNKHILNATMNNCDC